MRPFSMLLLTAIITLSGCSWMGFGDDDDKSATEGYTEQKFYEIIQKDLKARNWDLAIKNLQALEAQFPFGDYAEQAQLELIFAQYSSYEYEAAIAACDRFIRLHPQHPNVDYAFYMKGLSAIAQTKGAFGRLMPTDVTKRDPGTARNAFTTFSELLSRYPESPYAQDARKRMIYLRNLLARYEINVANYYFKRGSYVAAANRGRYVVENFQLTPAVPDALGVMAQAYRLLGMNDLADDAVKVLVTNYPDYPHLDDSGQFHYQKDLEDDSHVWLDKLTFGLSEDTESPHFDTRSKYNKLYQNQQEAQD